MNIPTIEELDRLGCEAAKIDRNAADFPCFAAAYLNAIRDAIVAACKPQLRPIAEMPAEVPDGCVRKFINAPDWGFSGGRMYCPYYIDIALPEPTYPADFERAFAESGLGAKDKAAAFKLGKGGAQ